MANEQEKIRLIIVDDEYHTRHILSSQLGRLEEVEIVGDASTGKEALEIIKQKQPDMALIDFYLKIKPDGYSLLKKAKAYCPSLKIATLTGHTNPYLLSLAVEYGADSIIIKSEKPLRHQIYRVLADMSLGIFHFPEERGLNQRMMIATLDRYQFEKALNETQIAIIALLAENKDYDEIANLLEKNVNHIRNSVASAIKILHTTEIPKRYPRELFLEIDTKEALVQLFQTLYPRFEASLFIESNECKSK